MHRYNWVRPHQYTDGLPHAVAKEKLNPLSGIAWPLHVNRQHRIHAQADVTTEHSHCNGDCD